MIPAQYSTNVRLALASSVASQTTRSQILRSNVFRRERGIQTYERQDLQLVDTMSSSSDVACRKRGNGDVALEQTCRRGDAALCIWQRLATRSEAHEPAIHAIHSIGSWSMLVIFQNDQW